MITVDTHVIIWYALRPELLSKRAKVTVAKANDSDGLIFCEISLWEIAMLMNRKKLIVDVPYLEFINLLKTSYNYVFKGLSPEIAELSTNLPSDINQDPADRIICATSIINSAPLLTADQNLRKAKSVKTIW